MKFVHSKCELTMCEIQLHALKTMRKNVLYAYYEKKFFQTFVKNSFLHSFLTYEWIVFTVIIE